MKRTIIFITCFFSLYLNAQIAEQKFGQIELSDLTMTRYEKDTLANALILFDFGNAGFVLTSENRFQFTFSRHLRIKIFNKSALHLADFSIRLYQSGGRRENIGDLKAMSYNLADGKIMKTKLENDKIYSSESKYYINKKFAIPAVKEGTVFELSYSITSDFLYNFRGWNFQYSCPALWSQYSYVIPEYFDYRESTKGYLKFDTNNRDEIFTVFYIREQIDRTKEGFMDRTAPSTTKELKTPAIRTTLSIKDVPAFISEPNIDNEENYLQSIELELSSVQLPNEIRKDYTNTWESVNKEMISDENFGNLLKSNGFISDTVINVCKKLTTEIEKAKNIYDYILNRMTWDGDYSLWAMKGLRKPFTDRIGNSSEINLLLILMLQTAGLKANPVIYSTRENGSAVTFFPTISKFNSVLALLEIDGKAYLLDAVNKLCPFGLLPSNDLNGRGRVVDNLSGDWVNLESNSRYSIVKSYILEIGADGKLKGSIVRNHGGYAAAIHRNLLKDENSNQDYIRKLQENTAGLTITGYSASGKYDLYQPLIDTLNVEISNRVELIGDKMLFNPLLFETTEKNIYTLEERKYPVDYNYPVLESIVIEYKIPAGYEVQSLPKPIVLRFPDNSISFTYSIQSSGNKIVLLWKKNISKIIFLPEEYKNLKEIYDQVVKKSSEQVILQKTNL